MNYSKVFNLFLMVLFLVISIISFNPLMMLAVPIVKYNGPPKQNSWARWMAGRTMRKNNNNLVSIVGPTGSGKTYAGMAISEIMAKIDGVPFTIDHIVFSLTELMDLINGGKLKKGSKILFDEPQISISAREFQSKANKVFNLLVSTFRHRNFTLFFCTPFESLLDKNTRRLFHATFTTMSINRNEKTCRLKPRFVEYGDFKAEPYRKMMNIFYKKDGRNKTEKVHFWDVPLPSKKLIDQYEIKKRQFTDRLNKNISRTLKDFDESGNSMTAELKEKPVERRPLTEPQLRAITALANSETLKEAAEKLGNSISTVHQNVKFAKKKGYLVEEFRKN